MIPALDVGHLPAAASFYSAVLQPLGLRYLSTDKDPNSPCTTNVVFGGSRAPAAIFQLQKSADPKPSVVTLSAPTAEAVTQFHQFALRANPDIAAGPSTSHFLRRPTKPAATGKDAETRARITDLDGNRMDVVYQAPPGYPNGYNGSTVRRTECSTDEVTRILDWNYKVAASDKHSVVSTRSSTSGLAYGGDARTVMARRSTAGTAVEPCRPAGGALATATKGQTGSGWNSTAVLGTMLGTAAGVVAGAALTYTVMKGDRKLTPRQEFDPQSQVPRRTTFPEQPANHEKKIGYSPQTARLALEAPSAKTVFSSRSKRAVDDMGHMSGGAADDYYGNDTKSGVSRYPPSAASRRTTKTRTRSSSEAGGPRKPLLITEGEHRSLAPSHVSRRTGSIIVPVADKAPSAAVSRLSRHTSASRREKEYAPAGSVHTARAPSAHSRHNGDGQHHQSSRAPSTYSRHEDDGRPLMANIPLDGSYGHHQQSRAPSAYQGHDKPPTVYDSLESLEDGGRPLMANIPLDGADVEYVPARSLSGRSSFSRSKPLDDFEVVEQDPAYVLDGRESHLSRSSRKTATRPPVVGGGGGMSIAGSRYGGERAYDFGPEKGQTYVSRSRAGSRVAPSAMGQSESGRSKRASSRSRAPTQVSARQVPLPRSRTGWAGDDDLDSVAPSDSISCVGSRRGSRYN
ncbi:hypothetical protein MKZ38_006645 [Zalerion maritima]|uniref:Uncharacterized protein n=1 Tax=Zalerion maritima TaxID=339359 RepID=A0AAD5RVC3_9PEZI|nr:hypothetical protein MKZ38_006645 [Zalerion maritima]